MAEADTLITGSYTDRGNYRENNEDAIFCRVLEKSLGAFALGAVCDGIGGLDGGEISSGYVIKAVSDWFEQISGWLDPMTADPEIIFSHLKDGAEEWNEGLFDYIRSLGIRSGTTLSALMLIRNRYYILNVGDSRIYRYSPEDGLCQLTVDSSVAVMIDGRMRSLLDNFMGKSRELRFISNYGEVRGGELFLVASDGFYHRLTETDAADIYEALSDGRCANEVCAEAVYRMLDRGERDNISVGVIFNKSIQTKHRATNSKTEIN